MNDQQQHQQANPLAGVADIMRQLSTQLPRRYVPNRADRRKAARGKRTA